MKLYLIRHAESFNNALFTGRAAGIERNPDPDITTDGHEQAKRLGTHLIKDANEPIQSPFVDDQQPNFDLTHLYCSLMTRSIQTAEYISKETGLDLIAHPEIFEKGGIYQNQPNGERQGLPGPDKTYFRERFPGLTLPSDLNNGGWYSRQPESEAQFIRRVQNVAADIRARHGATEDRVGLVVHGDFIDQFVNEVMGVPRQPGNYGRGWVANFAFNNTSVSRIDMGPDYQVVIYLNRIDHLSPDLVTW